MIVPLLNEAGTLPDLLAHLRRIDADEVILVDGGSTDGTRELLEASGMRWVNSPPGRALQMNAGAGMAQSDLLLFLHADTRLPAAYRHALRAALADGNVVGGRFDVAFCTGALAMQAIAWFMNWRSRLSRISTGDQAMFVRSRVFATMGGFAEIPLMEDVELSRRLKRQGRIACLRQSVCTSSRRWERHGIVRTVLLMWRMRLLFWLGASPQSLAARYRDAR